MKFKDYIHRYAYKNKGNIILRILGASIHTIYRLVYRILVSKP